MPSGSALWARTAAPTAPDDARPARAAKIASALSGGWSSASLPGMLDARAP
jgi:hypothetical protein